MEGRLVVKSVALGPTSLPGLQSQLYHLARCLSTYPLRLSWKSSGLIHAKCLEKCLVHSKCSLNGSRLFVWLCSGLLCLLHHVVIYIVFPDVVIPVPTN